ncbi:hypothetical protein GF420_07805 [candidate division GN15 bacterium]|nr:hypothetical protein [candidate division GN15 bacterium]
MCNDTRATMRGSRYGLRYPALNARISSSGAGKFQTADKLTRTLQWSGRDIASGRYRYLLYRFLADNIPAVSACIWTWSRLTGAPGRFVVSDAGSERTARAAEERLASLGDRMYADLFGGRLGLATFITELTTGLFRDGIFGGFLTVRSDASGVDRFIPVDPANLRVDTERHPGKLRLELETKSYPLDRPDFYLITLADSATRPLGHSILKSIPFVSYIEQQLVSDMQRASHNAGFHRLHVKITPPERMAGESDQAYTERINRYFDTTVDMIRACEVDDNPVTWDNVAVEYIGPSRSRDISNSWFMSHRAMIEEICAGTNLAPFLLGYSYGATTTWADFKFDIVMRQVRSVQTQLSRFLEWIGNVDLALGGLDVRCRYEFDNTFTYRAVDEMSLQSARVDNVLKLYEAGLIDQETARDRAGRLI